jgi:hypothetical protein
MKPMKKITDPTFKYTCAADTNIRKTFDRVRKEMKQEQEDAKKRAEIRQLSEARRKLLQRKTP